MVVPMFRSETSLFEISHRHLPGSSLETRHGVEVLLTPEGLDRAASDPALPDTIGRITNFVGRYGNYADIRTVRADNHPVTLLRAPLRDSYRGSGSGTLYIDTPTDTVIKASAHGYPDTGRLVRTHLLHQRLAAAGSRVQAPAQLALIRSPRTGQTAVVMDRVHGADLSAYAYSNNLPRDQWQAVYETGVRTVRRELSRVLGRTGLARLDDLAATPAAPNIMVNSDPRDTNTQFHVIDQNSRGSLSTLLHAALVRAA